MERGSMTALETTISAGHAFARTAGVPWFAVTEPLTVEAIVPVTGSGLARAALTADPIAAAVTGVGGVSDVITPVGRVTANEFAAVCVPRAAGSCMLFTGCVAW
jgi:hypothetical protein